MNRVINPGDYWYDGPPVKTVAFRNSRGREVGRLKLEGDELVFTGKADEAAEVWIEHLKVLWRHALGEK